MNAANRVKQDGVFAGTSTYLQLHAGAVALKSRTFKDGLLYGVVAARKLTKVPVLVEHGTSWLVTYGRLEYVTSTDIRLYLPATFIEGESFTSAGYAYAADGVTATVTCINSANTLHGFVSNYVPPGGSFTDRLDKLGDNTVVGDLAINGTAHGHNSIAIGTNAKAFENADRSIVIGIGAQSQNIGKVLTHAIAIGAESLASFEDSVVIGNRVMSNTPHSLMHGAMDVDVTVGAAGVIGTGTAREQGKMQGKTTNATPSQMKWYTANSVDTLMTGITHGIYVDSGTVVISAIITAVDIATSDTKVWRVEFTVKQPNTYSGAVLMGTVSETVIVADAGASTWDVGVSIVSDFVYFDITGEAAKNIIWTASYDAHYFNYFTP